MENLRLNREQKQKTGNFKIEFGGDPEEWKSLGITVLIGNSSYNDFVNTFSAVKYLLFSNCCQFRNL